MHHAAEITLVLDALERGDSEAGPRLFPLIYDELRRRAGQFMAAERRDHTLGQTALVHEAYLRLVRPGATYESRLHFFNTAALAMRRILIDYAEARGAAKRGGEVFFHGDLRPGNSPASVTFDNNVSFGSAAGLEIELGGTTLGNQYDHLTVSGHLSLDGTLELVLIDGFMPGAGQSFDILDWGTRSGTFASLVLPTLAGSLNWDTSQLYTTGVLAVVGAGLSGDFNGDGTVNAADYVFWRKNLGTPAKYDEWRTHFGQTAGSAGAGTADLSKVPQPSVVPEPASAMLVLAAVGIIGVVHRHART